MPMRIGVNTGKVFTGDFGPPYRRAYRVFGDAINTAARVMSKADAGPDPLDRDRARALADDVRDDADRAVSRQGQGGARARLDRRLGVGSPRGQAAETPLIGRDAELGDAARGVREVRQGTGWIVEISGEPGLGGRGCVQESIARCCRRRRPARSLRGVRGARRRTSRFRAPMFDRARSWIRTRTASRSRIACAPRSSRLEPTLVPWLPLLGILSARPAADAGDAGDSTSASCARRSPT